MATSHRVLLSPSTYIRLGVPLSLEVTRGRLPWLPPFICILPTFAHYLLCSQLAPTLHLCLLPIDKLNEIINNQS